jgi:hypothetical protein
MKPLQRSAANRGANVLPLSKRLNGCAQGCPAQFMLSSTRMELFCDVEPDVDLAAICAFADSFFDTGRPLHGLGRLKTPPLAMVRKTVPPPIMANAASMTPLGEIMRKFPPEQIVCKRAGSGHVLRLQHGCLELEKKLPLS